MAKHKFYQLEPLQVKVLRQLASFDTDVFTLLSPGEGSDPALARDWKLAQDLLALGLVADIKGELSVREKAKIAKNVPKGRDHVVLGITEVGKIMFDYCDDPECTEHVKRLPC